MPPFDFGSPISSYELVVDGTPVIIAGTPPSTEYVYAGLDPGTRHTFSIAATNAIGQGPFSTLAPFDTSDAVPLAPPEPLAPSHTKLRGNSSPKASRGPAYLASFSLSDWRSTRCC